MALRGPGEWSEKVLRELTDADVRAFNERAMTDEEARERREARHAAGVLEEEVLAVPKNMKLLAIPLFELYDNAARCVSSL